jgi:uncharacterized protein
MVPLLAVFSVLTVAAAIHAATGFGFALIAVPLVALVADVRTAVVGVAVAGVLLSWGTARVERAHVRWRTVGGLLLAGVAGMPLGLLLLRGLTERALEALVAVSVLACTVLVWRRPVLRGGRPAVIAAGFLSGVLATATGTNGPPLAAVFSGLGMGPREFRANFAAYFSVSGGLTLLAYAIAGDLSRPVWLIGAVGLAAIPLGWWLGDQVFRRFDAVRFRRAVLTMLVVTSAVTVMRAVTA